MSTRVCGSFEHGNNRGVDQCVFLLGPAGCAAKLDPADIPLPPSPDLSPAADISLPVVSESSPANIAPTEKTSIFDTPRKNVVESVTTTPAVIKATTTTETKGQDQESESAEAGIEKSQDGQTKDSHQDKAGPAKSSKAGKKAAKRAAAKEKALAKKQEQEEEDVASEQQAPNTTEASTPDTTEPATVSNKTADAQETGLALLSREQLEQKFQDLLIKTDKVNAVLKQSSPLLNEGIEDVDAIEGWIKMIGGKAEVGLDEIKRLNEKVVSQDAQVKDLKESHEKEQASLNSTIKSLRDQLSKQETTLSSSAQSTLQLTQARSELTESQKKQKDAEERLAKSINLLKTVRSKLVNMTKDKEEAQKSLDEEKLDKARILNEMEKLRSSNDKEVRELRQGFEKESKALKEKYEKETLAEKRKWELEMITTKVCPLSQM